MLKMTFGQRLRLLRLEMGLNQIQFCSSFNAGRAHPLTTASISQYEHDKRIPEHKRLLELAEYFGVTTDFLLGVSDNRHSVSESEDPDVRAILDLIQEAPELKLLFMKTGRLAPEGREEIARLLEKSLQKYR